MDHSLLPAAPSGDDRPDLILDFGFDADGARTPAGAAPKWRWQNYALADARARRTIEGLDALPSAARETLLADGAFWHVGYDDGWLHGELPDITHEHYSDNGEVGHLRFALGDTLLVSGRRQPLRSIEAVKTQIERGKRFPAPHNLLEAAIHRFLHHLATETDGITARLDSIEDGIVGDRWHGERDALTGVRREAVALHRQATTVSHLFRQLAQERGDELPDAVAAMTARLAAKAQALLHDCEQIQSRARLLQDELLAKLTAESNRLLYFLSVITAVLMPITIISGLFGMNVGSIPFSDDTGGFWIVSLIALMIALSVLGMVIRMGGRR